MFTLVGITAGTIFGVIVLYFAARLIFPKQPDLKTNELAASILFRIATLHALVIALVFASEIVEYQQLLLQSALEANSISDVYYDADRYEPDDLEAIREPLRRYVSIVAEQEWKQLGEERVLMSSAWAAWDEAYSAVLDLKPSTLRQTSLRENMLHGLQLIAENRDLREHHAKTDVGYFFWLSAILGVMLLSVGYYTFPPKAENLVLIALFAAYTGFILFMIFAMSNPFSHPGALKPVLFEVLVFEIGQPIE